MHDATNISGYFTVAQAAHVMGVSDHRVRSLVRSGELEGMRLSERGMLVDAASLNRRLQTGASRGRPFGQRKALAALWTLSGCDAYWLDYSQKRRLALDLSEARAERLLAQCRKRARVKRYRISPSFAQDARESIVLSGASALERYGFDLTSGEDAVEGYVREDEAEGLLSACFATEDPQGNFVLHRADWLPADAGEIMPEAVAAIDLADSLDTRTKRAGLDRLELLILGCHNADHGARLSTLG